MSGPAVVEHRPSRLARYAPGLAQLRRYDRSWIRADLVAGLVLAAILVPQGMAYAQLAGLPAVTGLYTTIACLVGYAIVGPSRLLVLGPDSSVSPLIFAAIVPILGASKDPADAIALAGGEPFTERLAPSTPLPDDGTFTYEARCRTCFVRPA